ncbi:SNF2 family N-terminal domain-containing protein [Nitrosospira sp. Nsp18]|uniref:DEAD/DEAH box helicase n=1 Tax=Nitrosospira sp. Nsp18 TaxID=1855334 RepID=UPI000889C73C|nr:helicase-related protein [Nitrosospira sp. Nsp18]SDA22305.1 SNF2 family N-terminal domain-containing protein [Nitrosospira sp. Nsp18]
MNALISLATTELEQFLFKNLPKLADDWWQKHVIDRLSFQQQRHAQEGRYKMLCDLDFAALLRILDQNWFELSSQLPLTKEARNWVKELQTVRNKWAHQSAKDTPSSEIYRDADTLGRVLNVLGAAPDILAIVEAAKAEALSRLAGTKRVVEKTPSSAIETPQTTSLFAVGNLVSLRSNPAAIMPVIEVLEASAGEYRYRLFQNNIKVTFYESQLQAVMVEDQRHTLTVEALHAQLTSHQLLSPSTKNLFSLRSGRVKFIPYQYRPVLKLIRADRPRLLIADEVGVGKTIEAGLIIKELRARIDLSSVLIICPKPLVSERKWLLEMKRFGEDFTSMDGPLLKHCLQETHLEGEWPEKYSKVILPFSLFDADLIRGPSGGRKGKNIGLDDLDPFPKFDLVIVDEAHHIRNSETFLHRGVRHFCENAEAVIFLTATPVQLGSKDLYTLLSVLRPDLIIDQASFAQMAEPNHFINAAVHRCRLGQSNWAIEARELLDEAAQTEWGRLFLREAPAFQKTYDQLQDAVLNDAVRVELTGAIEGFYTFSSLINRTRRRDIGEFTTRKPETLTVDFTPPQKELHDRLLEIVTKILAFCHGNQNVKFMMTTIRRQAASCLYGLAPLLQGILSGKLDQLEFMEASDMDTEADLRFLDQVRADIISLLEMADNLDPYDPKVEAFLKAIRNKQIRENNKALVFSTFRHTLSYLARHTEKAGLRYGLIHGGIPDEERSELRRRFRLPKDDRNALDILLSSEVGCEGLDFEFCDFLVNYDLPWNPMRVEQRIGRIDRYGQKSETVAIVNLITPGTVDAEIYERCLWRIGVFQSAIGGNEEILGKITQELHDIAESFDLTPEEREKRLKQLSDNGIRQIQEEQALELKQAELLGLNIPNQSWQKDIESAESYWLSSAALQCCVSSYLIKRLSADQEYLLGEKALKTLRLSQEARGKLLDDFKRSPRSTEPATREWEKWLKGAQPTVAVTFDQEAAVENSRAFHLSVTHPLVRQAAQYLKSDEPGYAVLEVNSEVVTPGEYQFGIYRWTKQGIKQEETLMPVVADAAVEEKLLLLLQTATTREGGCLPDNSEFDELDAQHYSKWATAQANHIAENRQQVEYQIQSLTVSHKARYKAIEDQLDRTTNDKIRIMKQSELDRTDLDCSRRMAELEQAAKSGDIHAMPVLFGIITIAKRKTL